jgi:hypothetical protein
LFRPIQVPPRTCLLAVTAWTVTEAVVAGAEAAAVTVSVAEPPGPTVDGLSVAVMPGGATPVMGSMIRAWRFAESVNPPRPCTVMVVDAVDPGGRFRKEAFERSLTPGGSVTVRLSGAVALRLPLAPVMVRAVVTLGA